MKKKSFFLLVLLLQIIFFTNPAHADFTFATIFNSAADDMTYVFGCIGDNFFSSTNADKANAVYYHLKNTTVTQAHSPSDFDANQKNVSLKFYAKTGTAYNYSNTLQKGFSITDTSGNQIIMRYIANENEMNNGIERSCIGFNTSGSPAITLESSTLYHVWFQIHNPMYNVDYRTSEHSSLRAPHQKQIDKNSNVVPYIDHTSNRAMVPLRCLAEVLNFDVTWDESTQQILLTKDHTALSLYPGSKNATFHLMFKDKYIYTENITLDVAPQIVHDRTFVPIRFVSEQFDCDVTWMETGEYIGITKNDTDFRNEVTTYPILDTEVNVVSLKTFNTSFRPYAMIFDEPIQPTVNIYSTNDILLLTCKESTPAEHTRVILPDTPDTLSLQVPELGRLTKGSYYADIQFTPSDKTVYRIFFEVQ